MKNRLFLLLPIAVAIILHACSSSDTVIIAGQVIEANSGNAINNAVVEVTEPSNMQQTATTDSSGNFSFDVDPGTETVTVALEVSKQGFQNQTNSFKLAPETNVDDLSIELQSSESSGDGDDNDDDIIGGDAGPPASLELANIVSSSIAIQGTGGDSESKFTFLVKDDHGRPVDQGHEIDFSIIQGPGGGEYIRPSTGTTSSEGLVSAIIASGDSSGVVKIQASVGQTASSTPVLVAIGNGFPESDNFRIAPVNQNFEAWNLIASSQSTVNPNYIVASLGDYRNNPVLPGTAVDFTTTAGNIMASAVTDEEGIAIVELRPDGSTPTSHSRGIGFGTVTAHTVDVNDNDIYSTADVLLTSRDPNIALLEPGTGSAATVDIPTDGSQDFDLVITDINGYPVAAGSEIAVTTSQGTSNTFGTKTLGDFISTGPGRTQFSFTVTDSDDENPTEENATVTITVTLPSGDAKAVSF